MVKDQSDIQDAEGRVPSLEEVLSPVVLSKVLTIHESAQSAYLEAIERFQGLPKRSPRDVVPISQLTGDVSSILFNYAQDVIQAYVRSNDLSYERLRCQAGIGGSVIRGTATVGSDLDIRILVPENFEFLNIE